jgi:hypothetical protein
VVFEDTEIALAVENVEVVCQRSSGRDLEGVVTISIEGGTSMSQMLGADHLELLTSVHTDGYKLMAFYAVVLSELIHERVFFTPLFIGVLNLFWMSQVVHLGSPVNSDPIEWKASSADVFPLGLEILVWSVIEDSDSREIMVCNVTTIKSMVISITEELVFGLLLVVFILVRNSRRFISLRDFLFRFDLVIDVF